MRALRHRPSPADTQRRRLTCYTLYILRRRRRRCLHSTYTHLVICQVSHGTSRDWKDLCCTALSPPQNSNKELCSHRNRCLFSFHYEFERYSLALCSLKRIFRSDEMVFVSESPSSAFYLFKIARLWFNRYKAFCDWVLCVNATSATFELN